MPADVILGAGTFNGALLQSDSTQQEHYIERLKELGYNYLVCSSWDQEPLEKSSCDSAAELLRILKKQGVGLAAKPLMQDIPLCPYQKGYSQKVMQRIEGVLSSFPGVEAIFWESGLLKDEYASHPSADDATMADLLIKELEEVENSVKGKGKLIFYVPYGMQGARYCKWMEALCNAANVMTTLAFPCAGGAPYADYLPKNPFWRLLQQATDPVYTPLLPVANVGCVKTGDGQWPCIPFDLFETSFNGLQNHSFVGVMSMTTQLPLRNDFSACNLWVASQMQKKRGPCNILLERWFKKYASDVDFEERREFYRRIRGVALELNHLHCLTVDKNAVHVAFEEGRLWVESLMAQLKYFHYYNEKNCQHLQKASEQTMSMTAFNCFFYDAKRIIHQFAQRYNITLPYVTNIPFVKK